MGWESLTLSQVGEPHPALYPKREGQSWVGYSFRVASLGSHFFPDFIYFKAFSLLRRLGYSLRPRLSIVCLFPNRQTIDSLSVFQTMFVTRELLSTSLPWSFHLAWDKDWVNDNPTGKPALESGKVMTVGIRVYANYIFVF